MQNSDLNADRISAVNTRFPGMVRNPSVARKKSYGTPLVNVGWLNLDAVIKVPELIITAMVKGYEEVTNKRVKIELVSDNTSVQIYQWLSKAHSIAPLKIKNNQAVAEFKLADINKKRLADNVHCIGISMKEGNYYWGQQFYNPYKTS